MIEGQRIPSTRERMQMAWERLAQDEDCLQAANRTGISYKRAEFMVKARRRMRREGVAVPEVWRDALKTPLVKRLAGGH